MKLKYQPPAVLYGVAGTLCAMLLAACGNNTTTASTASSANTIKAKMVNTANSTAGVLCDYKDSTNNTTPSVNAVSRSEWVCNNTSRVLTANGLPDHPTGTFPNSGNPNTMTVQKVSAKMPLNPTHTNRATRLGGPRGTIGYVLNGIKIDAGTAGSCDNSGKDCSMGGAPRGQWRIEALGQSNFNFGEDENNAHVQPGGVYHYHGMPEGFIKKRGGNSSTMTLIGWAADGFPIYARYGYSKASDATSSLKTMKGSYRLVTKTDASRPPIKVYPLGTFGKDWEYAAGTGDLDECNGRVGVTPEFPKGIYHYFATDSYPYFQRCVKGAVKTRARRGPPPGGRPRGSRGGRPPRGGFPPV